MNLIDTVAERLNWLAPYILRLGLAAVFVFFALHKLTPATAGQGAAEIQLLLGGSEVISLATARMINFYTGIFEALLALSLISGIGVRIAGLLAGGMISFIILAYMNLKGFGNLTADIYRDIGLAASGFAIFLIGKGKKR